MLENKSIWKRQKIELDIEGLHQESSTGLININNANQRNYANEKWEKRYGPTKLLLRQTVASLLISWL